MLLFELYLAALSGALCLPARALEPASGAVVLLLPPVLPLPPALPVRARGAGPGERGRSG